MRSLEPCGGKTNAKAPRCSTTLTQSKEERRVSLIASLNRVSLSLTWHDIRKLISCHSHTLAGSRMADVGEREILIHSRLGSLRSSLLCSSFVQQLFGQSGCKPASARLHILRLRAYHAAENPCGALLSLRASQKGLLSSAPLGACAESKAPNARRVGCLSCGVYAVCSGVFPPNPRMARRPRLRAFRPPATLPG